MSKREISSTLKNLKFMQRAAQREEKIKNQEEEKPDGHFFSPGTIRKCVVIMEGDPHPGSSIGRMSFQSFNPSVDKLNEAAGDVCQPESVDACASSSATPSGMISFRENGSSISNGNRDLKRKQSEVSFESQDRSKSPKSEGGQHSSANSSKGTFKRPKHDKLDWSVLRRKKSKQQR